jgi:hypothetical protein
MYLWNPAMIEYAQVLKMLGNGRIEAQCFDGEKRLAHIRGKMRKKVGLLSSPDKDMRADEEDEWTIRSGSTREISFFCLCEISRMTRPM